MSAIGDFIKGFLSVVTVTAAPQLYRYPYRTSAEALRGDMQKVGDDMASAFEQLPVTGKIRDE
jgi:hypothetical protein